MDTRPTLKILYLTNGMSSTVNSSFELSRRLVASGHEVLYGSQADIGARVEAQGYEFFRLVEDRSFVEQADAAAISWRDLMRPLRFLACARSRRRIRRASIENDEIERVVRSVGPDLLVVDMEMHFAILTTARMGIPTVLPIVWFTLFRHPGLPPMHTDLLPSAGGAIESAWRRLRVSTIVGEARRRLAQIKRCELFRPVTYGTYRIEDLRAVARSRGYDLRRETDRRQWLRPFLYRHLPILVFNAREMELPHEPHASNHYVGPMILPERCETQVDSSEAAEWRSFRDRRDRRRPLVYCSLGSFWSADERFLRKVVAVFVRRREWDLVIGLGGKLAARALGPAPENVLVLDFAPQLEVLQVASGAITHGGITTINECIRCGVPMLVYSTSHVDQDGCAARIRFHRLGVVSDKDTDSSEAIEANLERTLGDDELRGNVEAMREIFLSYERKNQALAVVEKIAAGGSGV